MATAMLVNSTTNNKTAEAELYSWHIPRPSLLACKPEKDHDKSSWIHHLHPYSSSRGSTSSQGSMASTHSTASGTLLLTAANLTSFAAAHPPIVTAMKSIDTASIASSTHFTVINGIGKPAIVCKKSWCARNQLTVLVCTMSLLFMIALLVGILYMEGVGAGSNLADFTGLPMLGTFLNAHSFINNKDIGRKHKKGCVDASCSCRKHGLQCTNLCAHCMNDTCHNLGTQYQQEQLDSSCPTSGLLLDEFIDRSEE